MRSIAANYLHFFLCVSAPLRETIPVCKADSAMTIDFEQLGVPREREGVVIVDHGSRREESNALLLEVVEAFRQASSWQIVEPAHMELAAPSLVDAFARCVEQGAELVVVFPYFLAPGRHWHQDIPALSAAAAESVGGMKHLVTAPLGLHPLMLEVIEERIAESLRER
jgi:sirohydrochlorin ferrochelatase